MSLADLAAHAAAYLALAGCALLAAAIAGIPLGLLAAHLPGARTPVLALANLARVVPSLAVLTFMLPILGVGFAPALVALALLAAAPLVITTDLGLRSVPSAAVDAARGMGMSPRQVLLRVEWPLALPLVIAGLRTATTEAIAGAVLAAFIGAGGLGEYVTTGLEANDPQRLWSGVGAIALIAILAEYALSQVQRRYDAYT